MQLFKFEDHSVRVSMHEGMIWFVAKDLCDCLGLSNSRTALRRLDDDEKGVSSVNTPGGVQEMNVINEPGMYSLVLTSRKEEAQRFKRWVTHEVLPSIRETGSYEIEPREDRSEDNLAVLRQQHDLIATMLDELTRASEERKLLTARVEQVENRPAAIALKDVPPMTKRKAFNRIVRARAERIGGHYGTAYKNVYRAFRERYSVDIPVRAKNRDMGNLDYAAQADFMDELLSLVVDLYNVREERLRRIFGENLPAELLDTSGEVRRLAVDQ